MISCLRFVILTLCAVFMLTSSALAIVSPAVSPISPDVARVQGELAGYNVEVGNILLGNAVDELRPPPPSTLAATMENISKACIDTGSQTDPFASRCGGVPQCTNITPLNAPFGECQKTLTNAILFATANIGDGLLEELALNLLKSFASGLLSILFGLDQNTMISQTQDLLKCTVYSDIPSLDLFAQGKLTAMNVAQNGGNIKGLPCDLPSISVKDITVDTRKPGPSCTLNTPDKCTATNGINGVSCPFGLTADEKSGKCS